MGGRAGHAAGVAAATLVVLGCTVVLRAPALPRSLATLAAIPESASGSAQGASGFRAVVVFQEADCESSLPWLRVFDEPEVRGRVSLSGVVVGRNADPERAADRMAFAFRRLPVLAAGRSGAVALWTLGYRSTPYVLIFDPTGRLRLAGPAPAGEEARAAFGATVRALVEGT
jgi:hypothetical protein